MKQFDVVALGELLIDFTRNGISNQGNGLFEANPGGAPCNVLAMLSKLERKTGFIGKVGKDFFGEMLADVLKEQEIHTDGLVFDEKIPTTLAFVHTKSDGDRSFSFYRNPGADMMLQKDELNLEMLQNTKVFHFGTLSMTDEVIEETTKSAIQIAKNAGAILSFDPNLRPPLWKNLKLAREKIEYGLSVCDVLKISDNEIEFMMGTKDIEAGVSRIIDEYQIPFICATMGKNGSKAFFEGKVVDGRPFLRKDTIETTGAGDTFCACMLDYILENGLVHHNVCKVQEMLEFANVAASLVTTRRGALRVMPTRKEVLSLR